MNILTDQQLAIGIDKTLKNAKALLDDANFLLENKRYARAYTLYQLSIEEGGKCLILYNSILSYFQGEEINEESLKKSVYYSHTIKTKESIKLELAAILLFKNSGHEIGTLLKNIGKERESVKSRNNKKNESLYVELIDGVFFSPLESISIDDVENIADLALIRIKMAEMFASKAINDIDKMKFTAGELKKIMNDPKLESEYQEKINRWIND